MRGAEGAVLAGSWCGWVRNNRVEGPCGTGSRRRNQTGMMLMLRLCGGRMVRWLSVVRSWSGVWLLLLLLLLEWLLIVLSV